MQTSVSRIFSKTGETLKTRSGPLFGLWATFFAAQIVLMVGLVAVIGVSTFAGASADGSPFGFGGGMILGIIVMYLVILLIAAAQNASLTAMASPLQRISFGDALNAGVRSALPMLGVIVLLLIGYFVCALVAGLVFGVVATLGKPIAVLLGLLLIPAVIYLACRLCVINAVVAVDGVGNPVTAIARGWAMTRGHVSTILGAVLLFLVGTVVLGGLLFYSYFTSMMAAATMGQPPSAGGSLLTILAFFVYSIAVSIVGAALFAVIHGELSDTSATRTTDVFG